MPVAGFGDIQDTYGVANPPVATPYEPHNGQAAQGYVVNYVDYQPEFTGGYEGWRSFLTKNLDVETVAEEQDITSL
jgi:hypothetical protein